MGRMKKEEEEGEMHPQITRNGQKFTG